MHNEAKRPHQRTHEHAGDYEAVCRQQVSSLTTVICHSPHILHVSLHNQTNKSQAATATAPHSHYHASLSAFFRETTSPFFVVDSSDVFFALPPAAYPRCHLFAPVITGICNEFLRNCHTLKACYDWAASRAVSACNGILTLSLCWVTPYPRQP
jgi:hypothetical protein